MRLNKYLAEAGVASRRAADLLIQSGRVSVNEVTVSELGSQVDPEHDKIAVDGKVVKLNERTVVYVLNKPRGVVTTASDPEGRKTVLEFVPKTPRVFPCGRLDYETMGLVVLTNDGNLCYQLTHPKFEHRKTYLVHGTAPDPQAAWEKLQKGVALPDGPVDIDELKLGKIHHHKIDFTITIHEGRNRIVRRLCGAVGIEVASLTRTKLGHYELGDLAPGEYLTV